MAGQTRLSFGRSGLKRTPQDPSATTPSRAFSGFHTVFLLGFLAAVACIQPTAFAQKNGRPDATAIQQAAQAQRRDWVRAQLRKLIANDKERAEALARLDRLSDDQVQKLATLCLDELESRRKQQFAALREQNARERAFQEQLARQLPAPLPSVPYAGHPVGYFPVITWLPEGTSLTAQGVVSPDGRHVRMSLAPFFSSIGPVYTFNFMTGETRRYDP